MVPMKMPNITPSPAPMTADSTVLTPQLFMNSSCIICSREGMSTRL
jgi:hypothetical protein